MSKRSATIIMVCFSVAVMVITGIEEEYSAGVIVGSSAILAVWTVIVCLLTFKAMHWLLK